MFDQLILTVATQNTQFSFTCIVRDVQYPRDMTGLDERVRWGIDGGSEYPEGVFTDECTEDVKVFFTKVFGKIHC